MKLDHCPVCSSNNIVFVFTAEDHLQSHENFRIYECHNCHLRFTNPRPDDDQLSSYYNSEEYISHTDKGTSVVNRIYKLARQFTLRSKRNLIEQVTANRTLLDVGCGTGHFISYCNRFDWNVTGVEPNDLARKEAKEVSNTTIYQQLADINQRTFDIISLWHVLEHITDLDQTVIKLKSLLAPKGKIIIAVPNYEAYEATTFNQFWAAYDVPRHLYHFSRKSMAELMKKHGLKIVKIYPMLLDSFYISLLSNKNRYGSNKYISSFITGLLSNIYARKSKNFSSLIYLISNDES